MSLLRYAILMVLIGAYAAMAQDSGAVRIPDIVKAGETVDLEITLNRAPSVDGSVLVWISGPNNFGIQSSCNVPGGEKTCHYNFRLPQDAEAGTWYVARLAYYTGSRQIDLSFEKLPFKVIANSGLIFPTSAEVAINPSQIQLFRRETARIQSQLQLLKASIAAQPTSSRSTNTILSRHVEDEIKSLGETESKFHDLDQQNAQMAAAHIFFDDLRASYGEILAVLQGNKGATESNAITLRAAWEFPMFQANETNQVQYPLAAQAVFRVFEQNELAYKLVADTERLTFDLEVQSQPVGATISYRRRGDQFQDHPTPTNSIIKSLPFAIWFIRFEKPGYKEQTIEHDPFREPNHVVIVGLTQR
jgi:hypothetical protein